MLSAICFKLDHTELLSSGNGLMKHAITPTCCLYLGIICRIILVKTYEFVFKLIPDFVESHSNIQKA